MALSAAPRICRTISSARDASRRSSTQVRTGENDGQIGRRPGDGFGDHVDDRLGEAEGHAGHVGSQAGSQLLDQVRLGPSPGPGSIGFQGHQKLVAIRPERLGVRILPSGLRADQADFRRLADQLADAAATSADCSMATPGGRVARIQITPSSSCGRNSVPEPPAGDQAPIGQQGGGADRPPTMARRTASRISGSYRARARRRKRLGRNAWPPAEEHSWPGRG